METEVIPQSVRKLVRSGYAHSPPKPGTRFEQVKSRDDYYSLLGLKLIEELREFGDEINRDEVNLFRVKEEAADVLEVAETAKTYSDMTKEQLHSIQEDIFERAGLLGVGKKEILEYQTMKRIELGGFSMGVVLIEEKKAS